MPPTYEPHVLIAFGGAMLGSPEIWATSVRCQAINGPYTQEQNQAAADGYVKNAIENLFLDPAAYISSDVQLEYIKVNNIAADGKYADPVTAVHYEAVPLAGTGGAPTMPYQISLAASLSAIGRGPGTAGRMYLPNMAVSMGAGGHLAEGETASLAAALVTMFHGFEAPALLGYRPGIFSSKGPWSIASTLTISDVPDTQRRRRNALIPVRAVAGL